MSKALPLVVGEKAGGTAEFLLVVDRLFDCLNISNLTEGKRKRKPFRSPYRNADDWKLKVKTFYALISIHLSNIIVAGGSMPGLFQELGEKCGPDTG